MTTQTTIRSPVRFSHKGLLTGGTAGIRLYPAAPDTGIVFNGTVPADLGHAFIADHRVGLRHRAETILGVEHLLSACYGLGIDNLGVEVTGGEVPFGDGSALPFVRVLASAGRRSLPAARKRLRLARPFIVHRDGSFLCALPRPHRPGLRIDCLIRFPDPVIGDQFHECELTRPGFLRELSPARTFGYRQPGVRLPDWLERTSRRTGEMLVPARPRFANEPARHKVLDLLGDLALLPARLEGHLFAHKTGHRLHHTFIRELEEHWK